MKVFVDTNVILEYFMHREEYDVAETLLRNSRREGVQMLLSVGAFYTMHYIILKYLRKEQHLFGNDCLMNLRAIMKQILKIFDVAEHDKDSLLRGISDLSYIDLEDSCQYRVAEKEGCSYLLTFNLKDYPVESDSPVKVLTPQQFLELHSNK